MRKLSALIILAICLTTAGFSQPVEPQTKAAIAPGNPFYIVESFVEDLEVGLAGIIGGRGLKAKTIANNAEESLAEAEKLAEMNKTKRAVKMIEKYERKLNRSQELAGREGNLSSKIMEISRNNVKRLEEVKKKLPEEAQKGIQNAIKNSIRRNRGMKNFSETKQPRTPKDKNRKRLPPKKKKPVGPGAGKAEKSPKNVTELRPEGTNKTPETAERFRKKENGTGETAMDKVVNRTQEPGGTVEKSKEASLNGSGDSGNTGDPVNSVREGMP
ncbi:MAG: DUF5667 domain-containing protein [Candidatus Nanohalobium sp.]